MAARTKTIKRLLDDYFPEVEVELIGKAYHIHVETYGDLRKVSSFLKRKLQAIIEEDHYIVSYAKKYKLRVG